MKKFKCMNIGNCANANTGKIFEIAEGEKEECPVCHKEMLAEVKSTPWGKIAAIIAAAAVVICGGIGAYFALSGGEEDIEPLRPKMMLTLNHTAKTLKVGDSDTIIATVTPEGTQAAIVWKASKDGTVEVLDGIVKALKGGSGKVRVQAIVGKDTLSAICKYSVSGEETVLTLNHTESRLKVGATDKLVPTLTPASDKVQYIWEANNDYVEVKGGTVKAKKPGNADVQVTAIIGDKVFKAACSYIIEKNDGEGGSRTLNLGFGTYKVDKNAAGEMHGYGTITYTQRHKIVGWKDYVAEPGDKFEGDFRNGNIVNGYWIRKSDGNRIFIN